MQSTSCSDNAFFEALEPRVLLDASMLSAQAGGPFNAASAISPISVGDYGFRQDGTLEPNTNYSSPLINLTSFRADPRFAGIDGSGFSVVVLDTGIDLDHPYFGPDSDHNGIADRIVYSWDFADNDSDASDYHNHGSNVASIMASSNSTYKGMAPASNIIALKVFQSATGDCEYSYLESALQWVIGHANTYNIASVNMSLGDGGNYTTPMYSIISDELATLAAMNVITVSAAGNSFYQYGSAQGVAYPAADPNSLAVGAVWSKDWGGTYSWSGGAKDFTTGADRIVSFSQRDDALVDIFAPGAIITGANRSGGTASMGGTSQASPHIAGLVALMDELATQTIGRRLTVNEFTGLLQSTGVTIHDGDDENDNVINTGLDFKRVDVMALGNAILQLHNNTIPEPTSVSIVAAGIAVIIIRRNNQRRQQQTKNRQDDSLHLN